MDKKTVWFMIVLLVIILVLLCVNFYFTWWIYNEMNTNEDNFDDLKDDINEIADFIYPTDDTGDCTPLIPDGPCGKKRRKKSKRSNRFSFNNLFGKSKSKK